jgi:hypothetical protein
MTTRHPTARRVHRPETQPDDAFVAGVLETTAWARKHQRILIIGGIAAAVLVTALVLWLTNRASTRERAATEISQVRAVALSGNAPLAIRELEQFVARYGRTPAGQEHGCSSHVRTWMPVRSSRRSTRPSPSPAMSAATSE